MSKWANISTGMWITAFFFFFFCKRKILKQSKRPLVGDRLRRFQSPVGTVQPINAVGDRCLLIEQDVHKVLSIEYTRLQRGYG